MKKLKNPFLLSGYYGKKYFCDREEEMNRLKEHLNNERNVVLYSWRRMGKTALIKFFMAEQEKAKKADTLYVDLLGTRDLQHAVKQITQAVYHRFGKTSSGMSAVFQRLLGRLGVEMSFDPITGAPSFSIGLKNHQLAERSLEEIGDFLASRDRQVVIALDEFQQVAGYDHQDAEAAFRSMMQSFPTLRFIFSGSHRHLMASMFTKKNRPFYRSAQLLELNPIDFEKYQAFIKKHFTANSKSIENRHIEQIYQWSRKQTYCMQLVCNKLFGKCDKVTQQQLQQVFDEILYQESPVFSNFNKLLTATQWKVMEAIAKDEPVTNPLSGQFVQSHRLGAASSVSTALKMLQKNELVIRDGNHYYIHDVLLARWLQAL